MTANERILLRTLLEFDLAEGARNLRMVSNESVHVRRALRDVIMEFPVNPNLTVEVPFEVRRSILFKFRDNMEVGTLALENLHWNGLSKHFGFTFGHLYYGVETDGEIHT